MKTIRIFEKHLFIYFVFLCVNNVTESIWKRERKHKVPRGWEEGHLWHAHILIILYINIEGKASRKLRQMLVAQCEEYPNWEEVRFCFLALDPWYVFLRNNKDNNNIMELFNLLSLVRLLCFFIQAYQFLRHAFLRYLIQTFSPLLFNLVLVPLPLTNLKRILQSLRSTEGSVAWLLKQSNLHEAAELTLVK